MTEGSGVANGDDGIQVRLLWLDLDEAPIYMADQFIGQVVGDTAVVTVGCAAPPVIVGDTEAERMAAAMDIGYVPVRPLTRVSLSRAKLVELLDHLQLTLQNYDNLHGGAT